MNFIVLDLHQMTESRHNYQRKNLFNRDFKSTNIVDLQSHDGWLRQTGFLYTCQSVKLVSEGGNRHEHVSYKIGQGCKSLGLPTSYGIH